MEITNEFDITSGGRKLTAGKGRRKLKAWIIYAAGPDKYFLVGDINRRSCRMETLVRVFEQFAKDPDAFEPGTPPTVSEICLTLPPGIDVEEIWEAPRCRGRKDRERALAWNKAKHRQYSRGSTPWYKRLIGVA